MISAFAALVIAGLAGLPRLHLDVYPVIATAGMLAALWLSTHTARRCGLSSDRLWDAGVFAIVAAFVISRVLGAFLFLVIERGHLSLSFMEILRFSTISFLSLVLTGIAVWFWLGWRRLPALRALDAWTAPAALLWAALAFANAESAAEVGMPTTLPWGILARGLPQGMRVHPIALYTAAFALLLAAVLLVLMDRRRVPGRLAGWAVIAAGIAAFLLDMLRAPEQIEGASLLDTSQWIALAGVVAGTTLLSFTMHSEAP